MLWVCVAAVAWRCPGEAELRYHVKMAASVESVAEAAHCRSNLLLNCAVVSGPVVQPKGPELSPVPTLVCWLSTMLHINMYVCMYVYAHRCEHMYLFIYTNIMFI